MAVGNYYGETNDLGKLCRRGSTDPILKNIFNRSEASNTLISAVTMGCSEQLVGGLEGIIFFCNNTLSAPFAKALVKEFIFPLRLSSIFE